MSRLVTLLGAQVCWWGCVLGAGTPYAVVAVVFTMVWIGLHLARSPQRGVELRLVLLATALGVVVDSALVGAARVGVDVMHFPEAVRLGPLPTPLWMVALWSGFATMLLSTLRPVVSSLPAACVFGLVGGPVSYLGGARLGPLVIDAPMSRSVVIIGVAWGLAMLVLALAVRRLTSSSMTPPPTTTRDDDALITRGAVGG
jgi:hypothetical protein